MKCKIMITNMGTIKRVLRHTKKDSRMQETTLIWVMINNRMMIMITKTIVLLDRDSNNNNYIKSIPGLIPSWKTISIANNN